jgi:hypothetical protein
MGRTIGAAVGALIVMLFFASLAARARNVSAISATVSAAAQTRTAQKAASDVTAPEPMRQAH